MDREDKDRRSMQNIHMKKTDLVFDMIDSLFEDTKGVIRIRILKNRQHNGQKKIMRSYKCPHVCE